MTQMEEITTNIEKHRSYLINLISKKGLNDDEIIRASQNLDKHLNIYHRELTTMKRF